MRYLILFFLILMAACSPGSEYDTILRDGMIYDGTGSPPFVGDIAISGDSIAAIGNLKSSRGKSELDVDQMAIAPGSCHFPGAPSICHRGHARAHCQGRSL